MDFQAAVNQLKKKFPLNPGTFLLIEHGATTFNELEKFGPSWMTVEFRGTSGFIETINIETSNESLVVEILKELSGLIDPRDWNTILASQCVMKSACHTFWLPDVLEPSVPTLGTVFNLS